MWMQAHLRRHVLEMVVAHVFVEHRILITLGIKMARERVEDADVLAVRPFFIGGVFADIADQQVEQSIIVVIKKEGAGRMRYQPENARDLRFQKERFLP
jgi:hypothetical protein